LRAFDSFNRDNYMDANISPLAGKLPIPSMLIDVPRLITAYYSEIPDPSILAERVIFGTSGHRGSSLTKTFNEWHILAISEAICLFRQYQKINGPLFLGMDTHALSVPAFASALEVLAAHDVEVMIAENDEYTPTPVISHAILTYNRNRSTGLADGIVITPSHNPPHDGGFKYNPPSGGPADNEITQWIEEKANAILKNKLKNIKRISFEKAKNASTTHRHDYLHHYVNDLANVIDMNVIKNSGIKIGVDPLGGAGVNYWEPIAERYQLDLTILNKTIDPTFCFVPVDWDGEIRMNPASPYAMTTLIEKRHLFDIAFACDTDHDRHGIVSKKAGLLPSNHYLCIAMDYLFKHRLSWSKKMGVGKTVVTTQMIDRLANKLNRSVDEVPVGFKWFVQGLLDGTLGFGGEQSAGASFSRIDGTVWTTDKDGMIAALLSAEITAHEKTDISTLYENFEREFGKMYFQQQNAQATLEQREKLKSLSASQITFTKLAGDNIHKILTKAPGNNEAIGGIKVISDEGWFVARPSGTEAIYEICAESFRDQSHLEKILNEAEIIVKKALTDTSTSGE